MNIIDVHDLPKEEANIVVEFVDFLREKLKSKQIIKEEQQKEQEWSELAVSSFSEDWENEKDAIYDNWQGYYHLSEG